MDYGTMIKNQLKAMRESEMKYSPQFTVQKLIDELSKYSKEKKVKLTDTVFPTWFGSWRGSYSELAINYDGWGGNFREQPLPDCTIDEFWDHAYDCKCWWRPKIDSSLKSWTVWEFLDMLNLILGKVMWWWKGGDFTVDESTPIWIANSWESGSNLIWDYKYTFIVWTEEKEDAIYLIMQESK